MEIPALHQPVEVYTDELGIAHARAASVHDAFVAQGYLHARDRLWQMDAVRRQMAGRWSEWVGPSGVAADTLARRLDADGASRRDFDAIGDEARGILTAYAAGVNAYRDEAIASGRLPYEYSLTGGEPEEWLPWHGISAMRQRGYLVGSLWYKLWRASALSVLPPEAVARLRWDDGGDELLILPQGEHAQRWTADLRELGPAIDDLIALADPSYTGGGSNNWCVSGERTASGRPLVAGDPHRKFELPGMYAQQHIACDEFDAIGLTVPGCPGFPHFAHNGKVAWGVTIAFLDLHDLYIERLDGERYLFRDEWLPLQRRTETIEVRGAQPVTVEVASTGHGPIVVGEPSTGLALSLKSIQFCRPDRSLDCMLPMLRAKTCDELFDATRGWGLVDHNLVAGDTNGTIGYLTRGTIGNRDPINGWLPVPGWTGEHEWDGVVPFERMPRFANPERGFLVTANHRLVAPDAGFPYLQTDCHPPHRAERVQARLGELDSATVDDMAAVHRDSVSRTAPLFIDLARAATPGTDGGRRLRELLLGWDGRAEPDSLAAAAYHDLRWTLAEIVVDRTGLNRTAGSSYATLPPGFAATQQIWWTLPTLVRLDDRSLTGGEQWHDLAGIALDRAAERPDERPWSERHRVAFQHPLAAAFPEAAGILNPTGAPVGGDNETVWACGTITGRDASSTYGSVARYVFDVGDWDQSRWIVLAGSSGDPHSEHYTDQHDRWSRCELLPMTYSWQRIEQYEHHTTLTPASD